MVRLLLLLLSVEAMLLGANCAAFDDAAVEWIKEITRETTPKGAPVSCKINNKLGFCVSYYLCDKHNTINTDGKGIIDKRSLECPNYLDVCCREKDIQQSDLDYYDINI